MEIIEVKNKIAGKNSDGLRGKAETTQGRIRGLENRSVELTQSDQRRKIDWRKKSNSFRDLGNNNRKTSICFIRVPEKREIRPKKT